MDKQSWENLTDAEIELQVAAALEQPDPNEALPANVPTLITLLTALGWDELDTLVAVPEGATPPTVMEWAGLALVAMPTTTQGRARGTDFEKALARIAAPGLIERSALARMKESAKAWQRRVEGVARDADLSRDDQEFADTEPAQEPLPLTEVAEEVAAAIEEWVDAPVEYVDVVVLWSFGTWGLPPGCAITVAAERGGAMYFPYLWITSVDPGSGKSTLLASLAAIVRRPATVQRITPSVLFRLVDARQPTLLMDEVGRTVTGNSDLEGLLDMACYRHGTVRLSEKVGTARGGETFRPRSFKSFTAVALGGLGRIAPTLRSRSIRLRMRPARAGYATLPLSSHMRAIGRLRADIGPHLAAHAKSIADALSGEPVGTLPSYLVRRSADNWRPLFAIAELIGGDWPARCLAACARLGRPREDDDESALRDVLDALQVFQQERTQNYAAAKAAEARSLAVARVSLFEKTGPEYDPQIPLEFVPTAGFALWLSNSSAAKDFAAATAGPAGRSLTAKAIAALLSEADVPTNRLRSQTDNERKQVRGFHLMDLERAWAERRPFNVSSEGDK